MLWKYPLLLYASNYNNEDGSGSNATKDNSMLVANSENNGREEVISLVANPMTFQTRKALALEVPPPPVR